MKTLQTKITGLKEIVAAIREVEAEARINPSMEVGERLNNLYSCLLDQSDAVASASQTIEAESIPALKLVA